MNEHIKALGLRAFKEAKADFLRDKHLIAVAYVVSGAEILDFNLTFEGKEQKESAYAELVKIAKEKNADAIITINDARSAHGESQEARECLYLSISGPNLSTWSRCLFYERRGQEIVFEEEVDSENDILNLLPGWPDQSCM